MDDQTGTHRARRSFAVPDVILLATDLEHDLEHLLPHAEAQARASNAVLKLVHVIPPAESIVLDAKAVLPADAVELDHQAKRKLAVIASKVRASDIECEVLVRRGLPATVVPEVVMETGANRLILGTHGRRHLKKFILGSVANEILRKVDIPVCTVGPHVPGTPEEVPQKLLHPVSLALGCEQSARIALEIAQFYKAAITLLHVLPRDVNRDYESSQVLDWTRAELKRLIPEEAPLWIYPTVQIEVGMVVEQSLNVADEMQADLIVLGVDSSEHHWSIDRDDTAYEIITQAKCPVLTLRRSLSDHDSAKEGDQTVQSQSG